MKLIYSHDRNGSRIIQEGPTTTERIADVCGTLWAYQGAATAIYKRHRLMNGHSVKTPNGRWLKVQQH